MSRKIVYIKSDNIGFPTLDSIYPASKLLETDKTVANTVYFAGQSDPEYKIPEWSVEILNDDDKTYYSILNEYTNEQLSVIDPDYQVMSDLDGNFTYTCLKYGYIRDLNKLIELGCPDYDVNVHTTYLIQNLIDIPEGTVHADITLRDEEFLPPVVIVNEENTEGTV
jgi:hypothetical protein